MILVVKGNDRYYMATNAYFSGVARTLDSRDAIDEDNINIFFNPKSRALIGSGWSNPHFDILKYHLESFTMEINTLNLKVAIDKLDDIEKEYGLSYKNDEDAPNFVFIQDNNAYQISNSKMVVELNDIEIISDGYENCAELKCLYQTNSNCDPIERIKESIVDFCKYRKVKAFPIVIYDSLDGKKTIIYE